MVSLIQKTKPYDKLAVIYNRLMDHVNYPEWCLYIQSFFSLADIETTTILDISCGTGNLLKYLKPNTYRIYGCDYSPSMVYEARRINKFPLFISDGRQIAAKSNTFHVVLFLYDSLNYLLDHASIKKLFREVRRVLITGGLFIFDIVTDKQCKNYYRDFYENEYWGNCGYNRHSYYRPELTLQFNEFHINLDGAQYRELHRQRIYSVTELAELVKTSDLLLLKTTMNFSVSNKKENSDRIHFICKKNGCKR